MRLYKPGQDIHQIPDALKAAVPDEIKDKARDMARKELAARLAEIDLTSGQASIYSGYHDAVAAHVQQLVSFLDNLEANEEERVWLKRQADGELDDSRLTEGLTGESTVYKRRGLEKRESRRAPQICLLRRARLLWPTLYETGSARFHSILTVVPLHAYPSRDRRSSSQA